MTEKVKTGCSRWVKGLLVVSLGVNLLIAGTAIGIAYRSAPPPERSPDAVAFLSFALPKEHRNALREQLISRRSELHANRAEIAGMRAEMISALQADPFEISDVETILQRQRDRFLNLGELAHNALLERIASLTPEERAIYVESLKKGDRRRRP